MSAYALQGDERIGLLTAVIAHAALIAMLVMRPATGDVVRPPERITVTLSDEIGLTSTSPDPFSDAAPDVAPTIGEAPAVEPTPAEVREPPRVAPVPPRQTRVVARRPVPDTRERRRPDRPAATPRPASRPAQRAGGSRLGNNFLEGVQGGTGTQRSGGPPAKAIGPRVRSALAGQISRQLYPYWSSPQGVDVEQLVTVLTWNLNKDGSLSGQPRVVTQLGVTAANRAQTNRHAEQAIRAIQLAAPFNLPPEYYDGWKRIKFDFDKSLSR